ncbi:MAG: FAD-dependent oxidoreductase, partial [Sandaracinaceae bacterium]|nr:FAD-dependent oxidoreductase [Sandaracinaceae bacterium]
VVLTLPFTMLRMVDVEAGLFADDKAQIVSELGYGQNSKLMMQLTSKPWRTTSMAGGAGFTDNGAQTFWETSRGQSGELGILTHFAGGDGGLALGAGTPDSQATRILPLLDAVFPGTQAAFNGRALRMHWPQAPFHGGSYACYRPGQWEFFGVEGRAEGNIHFAGEHTSEDYQGYMEGAAESGARAAREILAALGIMAPAPLRSRRSRRPRRR